MENSSNVDVKSINRKNKIIIKHECAASIKMKTLNCPFIKQIRMILSQGENRHQKMTVCHSDTDNHLNQAPRILTGYALVNEEMKIPAIKEFQQLC